MLMDSIGTMLANTFLVRAILVAFMASCACGVLGTYVVLRRDSYMVGAVSHSLLGGIGISLYCQAVLGLAFFTPLLGAVAASLLASIVLTVFSRKNGIRSDTVLSAIWTGGVALGLCLVALIPGYAVDLNNYLFGNILLVGQGDIYAMLVLDVILLLLAWLYHSRFIALCFNQEWLELRGISTFRLSLLMNVLIGLAVVLLAQAVGLVMALALMVLPAATAARFAGTLGKIMLLAFALCLVESISGLFICYFSDCPAGAAIIILSVVVYIASVIGQWVAKACRR